MSRTGFVDGQLERAREWQFNAYKKSRGRLKRARELQTSRCIVKRYLYHVSVLFAYNF